MSSAPSNAPNVSYVCAKSKIMSGYFPIVNTVTCIRVRACKRKNGVRVSGWPLMFTPLIRSVLHLLHILVGLRQVAMVIVELEQFNVGRGKQLKIFDRVRTEANNGGQILYSVKELVILVVEVREALKREGDLAIDTS